VNTYGFKVKETIQSYLFLNYYSIFINDIIIVDINTSGRKINALQVTKEIADALVD